MAQTVVRAALGATAVATALPIHPLDTGLWAPRRGCIHHSSARKPLRAPAEGEQEPQSSESQALTPKGGARVMEKRHLPHKGWRCPG